MRQSRHTTRHRRPFALDAILLVTALYSLVTLILPSGIAFRIKQEHLRHDHLPIWALTKTAPSAYHFDSQLSLSKSVLELPGLDTENVATLHNGLRICHQGGLALTGLTLPASALNGTDFVLRTKFREHERITNYAVSFTPESGAIRVSSP